MNLRTPTDPQPAPVDLKGNRRDAVLRELELKSLPYLPLPQAPLGREVRSNGARKTPKPQESFEIYDASWQIKIEILPPAGRPDPAFRRLYPVHSGLIIIDNLGNARGLGSIEAAAIRYDREGRLAIKAGFARGHDCPGYWGQPRDRWKDRTRRGALKRALSLGRCSERRSRGISPGRKASVRASTRPASVPYHAPSLAAPNARSLRPWFRER